MGRKEATQRLIKAIEQPHVSCIGHPSGRLINTRPGMDIDIDKIAAAAAAIENIRLTEENLNKSLLSHIGENIANSAHGIKNILNNIDGGTFIVERGVLSHKMEMVDKGWDIMKRNSYRLRELVLDMLLFSRPTKPEYIPSDINKICRDVYELIAERAKEEHTGILLDLDNSIGEVCIDPKGIYRCGY